MGGQQRVRQACRAVALPLVLVVAVAWGALFGIRGGEPDPTGGLTRLVAAALAPQSAEPVVPDARLAAKPAPGTLLLLVAAIVALLFGGGRRVRWPVASGMGSAATPSLLLHTVRGRAPPRQPA